MKKNDMMKYYIEKVMEERIEKAYPNSNPETRNQIIDTSADILLMTADQNPDLLYLLRALELACADLEAHIITPSAEDFEAWQAEQKAKRVKERDP